MEWLWSGLIVGAVGGYLYGCWTAVRAYRKPLRQAYDRGRSDAIQWMYENV